MLSIGNYKVSAKQSQRWRNCDQLALDLNAYNNVAPAESVFEYLNRPLPKGVKPDDEVDCSAALPELLTVAQLADRAGKPVDRIAARVKRREFGEDIMGDDDGEPLYYWVTWAKDLTGEMLTINALSERFEIDKRTIKKHLTKAVSENNICPPIVKREGGREYNYYWQSDVRRVLGE